MLLQGGRGTWFHVVVGVIGSVQQSPLRVPEWRECLPIVVVWDVETLSLSLQGPAAIVLRQGRSRRHHAREKLDWWWSLWGGVLLVCGYWRKQHRHSLFYQS